MPDRLRLVLLPGLDGTGRLFDDFVDQAPPGVATLVVSYPPSTPLSYADTAAWVAPRLPASEPYVLVAESYSGPAAILLAARRDPALRAVVLCNTFAVSPAWSPLALLPWQFVFRRSLPNLAIGAFLVGLAERTAWAPRVREAAAQATPAVLAERLRSVLTVDVCGELARAAVPFLYLRGTRDRLVSARSLERVVRARPTTSVALVKGPHLLLQTRPGECWGHVVKFVHEADG